MSEFTKGPKPIFNVFQSKLSKKGTELKIATHIESISPLLAVFTVAILSFNTFYGNFYLNQQKLA